ncbi:hypothetical protein ScPMuIL_018621 [Solemya velum]
MNQVAVPPPRMLFRIQQSRYIKGRLQTPISDSHKHTHKQSGHERAGDSGEDADDIMWRWSSNSACSMTPSHRCDDDDVDDDDNNDDDGDDDGGDDDGGDDDSDDDDDVNNGDDDDDGGDVDCVDDDDGDDDDDDGDVDGVDDGDDDDCSDDA